MKKTAGILLCLLLFIMAGCSEDAPPETTPPPSPVEATPVTTPPSPTPAPFADEIAAIHALLEAAKAAEEYSVRSDKEALASEKLRTLLAEPGFSVDVLARLNKKGLLGVTADVPMPLLGGSLQCLHVQYRDTSSALDKRLFRFARGEQTAVSELFYGRRDYMLLASHEQNGDAYVTFLYEREREREDEYTKDCEADIIRMDGETLAFTEFSGLPTHLAVDAYESLVSARTSSGELVLHEPYAGVSTLDLSGETPRFVFETAAFDVPGAPTEQGILLGLSGGSLQNRTLFVYPKDGRLICREIPGEIVFPRKKGLYSVRLYEKTVEQSWEDSSRYPNELKVQKLLTGAYGEDMSGLLSVYDKGTGYMYTERLDRLYYVGGTYTGFAVQQEFWSGGSYHYFVEQVHFAELYTLNDVMSYKESLYNEENATPHVDLSGLLLGKAAEQLRGEAWRDYPPDGGIYLDFSQLMLRHEYGRWRAQAPVFACSYHPGNGSSGRGFSLFADTAIAVPDALAGDGRVSDDFSFDYYTSYRDGYDTRDVTLSPDGQLALVLKTYDLCAYTLDEEGFLAEMLASVKIAPDEYIVSIHWADGAELAQWEKTILHD